MTASTSDDTTVSGESVNFGATVTAQAPGAGLPNGTVQLVIDGNNVGAPVALTGGVANFDPVTNLRVGVKVLQDCIARAGSVQAGLKYYVGAANIQDDGGYASKVMAERARLYKVATGHSVPVDPTPVAPPPRLASGSDGVKVASASLY